MIRAFHFMRLAWRLYRACGENGIHHAYLTETKDSLPWIWISIGKGTEAVNLYRRVAGEGAATPRGEER